MKREIKFRYQLKLFLASKESIFTFEEQHLIEHEITEMEKIKHYASKIIGK